MIDSDYSHADQSAEIQALDVIERRAEKGEIPPSVARKILDDNLAGSTDCGRFLDRAPVLLV